ncbi:hypothetical protein FOCC_FOCC015321 [Frankliniella occidentalis]|nr:hypothetical protein FOCC_FOCC015321 [Frankliniella occidentalis]
MCMLIYLLLFAFAPAPSSFSITRISLLEVLREKAGQGRKVQIDHAQEYVLRQSERVGKEIDEGSLRVQVSKILSKMFARLDKKRSNGDYTRYIEIDKNWLSVEEKLSTAIAPTPHSQKKGRPKKPFDQSCKKTKRRKLTDVVNKYSSEELLEATAIKLRSEGKGGESRFLSNLNEAVQSRKLPSQGVQTLAADVTLGAMVEADLSKNGYLAVRQLVNSQTPKMMPSYDKIQEEKQKCYPSDDFFTVTDFSAEVDLQALLDHTSGRIIALQDEVLEKFPQELCQVVLVVKWGFDGSSSHAEYNNHGPGDGTERKDCMFLTSMAPVQMRLESNKNTVVWQNPRPSSTRYCRPIRFQQRAETKQLLIQESAYIEGKIRGLDSTDFQLKSGKSVTVRYEMCPTMLDGKASSAAQKFSDQSCSLCGARPGEMNNLGDLEKTFQIKNPNNLKYGIPPLHSRIRSLECMLFVSYRIGTNRKSYQKYTDEQAKAVSLREKEVRQKVKENLNITVDKVVRGSGTSNTGNTARKFFDEPRITAEATGLDETLLHRLSVILDTLASGLDIDVEKFKTYAHETARLYVQLYPWNYVPSTVHKMLIHGHSAIEAAPVPIGMLSEEGSEALNKYVRNAREFHTRKFSSEATNEDLLKRLLVSSDPAISSLRRLPQRNVPGSFRPDVQNLLKPAAC